MSLINSEIEKQAAHHRWLQKFSIITVTGIFVGTMNAILLCVIFVTPDRLKSIENLLFYILGSINTAWLMTVTYNWATSVSSSKSNDTLRESMNKMYVQNEIQKASLEQKPTSEKEETL